MNYSERLLQATRLVLTNESALPELSYAALNFFMTSALGCFTVRFAQT